MLEAVRTAAPFIADALVIVGALIMTIGVYGAVRMPDTYTKLHAMSKAVFLGVISLCAASLVTGDSAIILRVVLIGVFLLITTPISAFTIGRAAYLRQEPMQNDDAQDESAGPTLSRGSSA